MAIEASSLQIKVQSSGVSEATEALNKLAAAGDKAEKSAAKLSQSNKGQEASAKKQEALWYDLIDKASKYYERQWNVQQKALQRQNQAAEAAILREANAMNKAFDKRVAEEKASYDRLQREADKYYAQQQRETEQSYTKLQREAEKYYRQRAQEASAALRAETQQQARAYAAMQSEAIRMNAEMDRVRKQNEANARASAERMAINNARFSTASSSSRLNIARQAAAYGASGGDVVSRFGSEAASMANARGIQQLTAEHERLQQATNRSRAAMQNHTNGMSDAHAMARGLTGSLGALWLTYGNVVPLALGAAIGASFKQIVSEGSKVENILQAIGVRGEETTESVNKLRAAVLDMGKGVYGPLEVANAFQTLILAGLSAEQSLKGVKDALNLATVGGTSIEKSATTLVQVGTAMGYTAEGFTTVADVISKTAAATMSDVESLSEAFKSASAVGKLYKVSLQDLATELGALSQLGIQGSAAGTSVKNFYKELSSMSDKTKNTLKDMGLTPKDFKDASGGFLDLITVVGKLNGGLSKLREDQRALAIQNLSNERGLKTAVEVLDMYNEKVGESSSALQELRKQIGESGGYASQGAARMALTAENQMKSTVNTMKTSFVEAFKEIEPQVTLVARAMRDALSSDEFKASIQGASMAIANFGLALMNNLPVIVNVGKALIALKIATVVASAFLSLGKAVETVGVAMAGLSASTLTLGVALPALGVVLAAAAAAWALYSFYKDSAFDDSKSKAALAQSNEFIDNLDKENKRIAEANRLMKENIEGKKALQVATQNLAVQEIKANHDKGIIDLEFQRDKAMAELPRELRQQLSDPNKLPKSSDISQVQKVIDLQNAVSKAYVNKANAVTRAEAVIAESRRVGDENAARNAEEQEKKAKEAADKAKNAVGMLTVKPDKEETQRLNFIKQQRFELEKLAATYDAKNRAMEQSFITGKKVMADTQEAMVNVALAEGKYGSKDESNVAYQAALKLARLADEAKLRNENNKKVEEFKDHLQQVIVGEKEFQAAAEIEANAFFGQQRRKAEGLIKNLQLSDAAAERLRTEADLVDQINKAEGARAKLRSAIDGANARGGEAEAEAESMLMYGTRTKATALEIARLAIEKAKLTSAADEGIKKSLLEAAATEQSKEAYRSLVRQQLDMNEELKKAQADSLGMFSENEIEKVRIAEDAAMRIAKANLAAVENGNNEKLSLGTITPADLVRLENARNAFAKLEETIVKTSKVKLDNIKLKEEINQWKLLGKTIEDSMSKAFGKAGDAAGKMFNLFAQGQANDIAYAKEAGAIKDSKYLSETEKAKALNDLQYKANSERLGEYAGMADAAKGFFDENSKGYQAMTKAAQIMHAAEVALSIVKGINAVLTQGEGDPYTAFARMAAMTAMVAALGVAISGGGSGGGLSAKDQQQVQGSGSVLGSRTVIVNGKVELVGEKSESIKNSLSILEKNSGLGLVQNNAMLRSMQTLSNSISALAAKVAGNAGVTGEYKGNLNTNNGGATTLTKMLLGGVLGGGVFAPLLTSLMPKFVNNFIGKVATAIFGGKQSVDDTGFTIGKDSLSNIMSNGVNANQYAKITTSGGWFSSDKHSTELTSVGKEANDQFTKVILQMSQALEAAANVFGMGGDSFTQHLKSFVVDIGNISLKDLKGADIEKALSNVFSKLGDDMAMFAFGNLQQYQKVGEGMLETVSRVANDLLQVNDVFAVMGKTLPKSVESIAEAEKLISNFGSLDDLTSKVGSYVNSIYSDEQKGEYMKKNVDAALKELGFSGIETKAQFKDIVDKAFGNKDYELYSRLLNIAEAFGQVTDAAEKAKESAIKDARTALTDAYDRESKAIKETQDRMVKFVATLKELQKSALLGELSPLTPQQKYLEAKSQFEKVASDAQAGDEAAQGRYEDVYKAFLEASKTVNASGDQYQKDFAFAQELTQKTVTWTQKQVDVAQASLDALNLQVAGLITINNSVLSVTDAINNLIKAQGGDVGGVAADNAKNAIESLYQNILGRHSDAAGLQFWIDSMSRGNSISDIARLMANSPEALGQTPATAITPVTAIQSGLSSNRSADIAAGLAEVKQAIVEVKSSIEASGQNMVGAVYGSQDAAAEKTVDGISEAIYSGNKAGMYKLTER